MKPKLGAAVVCGALAFAALAKLLHRNASADQLGFLLRPTAWLVELSSGFAFTRERGVGYSSHECGLVIAKACSGANYLLVVFCSLTLSFRACRRAWQAELVWLALRGVLAYVATICVNAARILFVIWLERPIAAFTGLLPAQVHRIEGVILYLGSLLALHALVERAVRRRHGGVRFDAWPFTCYLAVTLLAPLALGAMWLARFREHASVVIVTSAALLGFFWALRFGAGLVAQHRPKGQNPPTA